MVDNINSFLNAILTDFLNSTSNFLMYAKLIAGLGALIVSFVTFRKIQMEGDVDGSINSFVIKVVLVSFGISFYGTFVGLINKPLELMTEGIKSVSQAQTQDTNNIFATVIEGGDTSQSTTSTNEEYQAEVNDALNQAGMNNAGSGNPDSESILNQTSSADTSDMFSSYIYNAIFNVLCFIASIALVILNIIRTFILIILSMFGIFVIAISMYPGFENSFYQWLQKYINVYLWLPIGYILDSVLAKLFSYQGITNASVMDQTIASTALINLMAISCILAYTQIPTIANWLISASMGNFASKAQQSTVNYVQSAAKNLMKGPNS
ncbi:TrbL/VirB6 plasmid conjugal transfer protein [Flavobacterium croceum DSM 17960]|uniref:TrbL/VirB6 plasmid conjugal transfer protein n=1 Tax=Flavobacterium croceum DSM 17960 TaxID=1121886 RepID=A0A2S4N594_9FLAO|nr:hypothetical protein [Flavobacterium croceum]POS00904.1 TrbL/VirB6 plasmid conjugal transfer protein [Flavobacterium croceum DSM 17960]